MEIVEVSPAQEYRDSGRSYENEGQLDKALGAYAAARDEAGLPDAGKQRYQMVEELQQLNRRVADLERGLRDGAFVIRTIEAKPAPTPSPKDEAKETQR